MVDKGGLSSGTRAGSGSWTGQGRTRAGEGKASCGTRLDCASFAAPWSLNPAGDISLAPPRLIGARSRAHTLQHQMIKITTSSLLITISPLG